VLSIWTASVILCWGGDGSAGFSKKLERTAISATVWLDEASGVIIGRDGSATYILTANHCLGGLDRVNVTMFTVATDPKPAEIFRSVAVIARAPTEDLALLRVITPDHPPGILRVCPTSALPRQGEVAVLTVGCNKGVPTSYTDTVREKRVIRRKLSSKAVLFWESDIPPASGRSGGPIVDAEGRLLGVCCAGHQGKGYYCHTEEIHKFLKDHDFKWLFAEKNGEKKLR
jgi:S1-C subfamily serine protease